MSSQMVCRHHPVILVEIYVMDSSQREQQALMYLLRLMENGWNMALLTKIVSCMMERMVGNKWASKDATFTKVAFIAHNFSAFIVNSLKNQNGTVESHTYYNKVLNQTVRSSKVHCIQTCQPCILHRRSEYRSKEPSFLPLIENHR